MRPLAVSPQRSTSKMHSLLSLSLIPFTIFLALLSQTPSISALQNAPLLPFPVDPEIDLDEDIGYSFQQDLRHILDNGTLYDQGDAEDDGGDEEGEEDEEDNDVAFNVFEMDDVSDEEDVPETIDEVEEDAEDAEDVNDSNEPSGDVLAHKRNKRFVITRGADKNRRHGSGGRRRSSSHSSQRPSSSRSGGSSGRATATKEEPEGHGHAEGGGRRGGRGIKFTKRFNIRRKTSSRSKPKTSYSSSRSSSSSSSSSTQSKHSLPDKPIWQIKWPKRGKTVRSAIQENRLFKDEVMKLKLKIGSLTEEQKTEILDQHNKYRGQLPGVSGYPISEIPRAQDMQKMVWDKELEKKAKIHAEKCLFAHDTRKERHLDNLIVGQNIAVDTNPNFAKLAVPKWYGEIALCKWDLSGENEAKRRNKRCTEYAQLVWSNSSRLGCASVWCPEVADWDHTGYNLVCNYGPEGNAVRTAPFTPARNNREICKKCPGKCTDGLCDCGGKVCYNGGSLDVSTCQCSCNSLWKGPTCLEKSCPPTDPEACGLPYPKGYPKSYCKQYHEVLHECPYMCGICTGARCGGKKCVNGGTLDLKTCQCNCRKIFTGDTCKTLSCPAKDSWFCGTTWDKSYCRRIITAQFECPYMCNICKK